MVSSLPELVGVLLFLWFRKVFSVQVGGAWHPALVVQALFGVGEISNGHRESPGSGFRWPPELG